MMRLYNFAAGPATNPHQKVEVVEKALLSAIKRGNVEAAKRLAALDCSRLLLDRAGVDYKDLPKDVKTDDILLLDDGRAGCASNVSVIRQTAQYPPILANVFSGLCLYLTSLVE